MRGLFAQNIRPEKRDEIVSRQKLLDRPDAGIARFQHAILLNAHRQPHTAGPDALDFADIRNEVFGNVQFHHTHDLAPCLLFLRNAMLRLGHCNQRLRQISTEAFCRGMSFDIARMVEDEFRGRCAARALRGLNRTGVNREGD